MDILVVGTGVVGTGVVRHLACSSSLPVGRIGVAGRDRERVMHLVAEYGPPVCAAKADDPVDIVVLATGTGSQARLAERLLGSGRVVLTTTDSLPEAKQLLSMDDKTREQGSTVVVGAGMAPGLSNILAVHAASTFDRVTEVHVAKFGTGGPACARRHHRALSSWALEWQDGWVQRPGGSGRELCWFPSPVDAADCYRAALPDPLLIARNFRDATRITARMAATKRDRFSSWLPMLRPPHPEGKLGAVRVEVRGQKDNVWMGRILGVSAPPAAATAATVLGAIELRATGEMNGVGTMGLAEAVDDHRFLEVAAAYGVVGEEFSGA